MTEIKNTPKIKSYNDFVTQLKEITKQDSDIVLSFYKYCWTKKHNSKDFKDLMIKELEPFGLKPFVRKFTEDMNIILKYKRQAEAIIYIGEYEIDLLIYKKWLCRSR